ncbi:Uncharacterized protein Adt_08017 [Abeliophyllum distichum]|uniref:ADP-ribosylation factor n=1 Tax=Abeliophyllum distichum TaxID=126358 RepID=A0ABD1VBS0_9LAMI
MAGDWSGSPGDISLFKFSQRDSDCCSYLLVSVIQRQIKSSIILIILQVHFTSSGPDPIMWSSCQSESISRVSILESMQKEIIPKRELVGAFDRDICRAAGSNKELDALLSGESLANVSFLVLRNKIDIPYAASEDELRHYLG